MGLKNGAGCIDLLIKNKDVFGDNIFKPNKLPSKYKNNLKGNVFVDFNGEVYSIFSSYKNMRYWKDVKHEMYMFLLKLIKCGYKKIYICMDQYPDVPINKKITQKKRDEALKKVFNNEEIVDFKCGDLNSYIISERYKDYTCDEFISCALKNRETKAHLFSWLTTQITCMHFDGDWEEIIIDSCEFGYLEYKCDAFFRGMEKEISVKNNYSDLKKYSFHKKYEVETEDRGINTNIEISIKKTKGCNEIEIFKGNKIGEGEMKIWYHIINSDIEKPERFFIYMEDSDIIPISLILMRRLLSVNNIEKRVYWVKGKEKKTMSIHKMYRNIYDYFMKPEIINEKKILTPIENFVWLITFPGNDFIEEVNHVTHKKMFDLFLNSNEGFDQKNINTESFVIDERGSNFDLVTKKIKLENDQTRFNSLFSYKNNTNQDNFIMKEDLVINLSRTIFEAAKQKNISENILKSRVRRQHWYMKYILNCGLVTKNMSPDLLNKKNESIWGWEIDKSKEIIRSENVSFFK